MGAGDTHEGALKLPSLPLPAQNWQEGSRELPGHMGCAGLGCWPGLAVGLRHLFFILGLG